MYSKVIILSAPPAFALMNMWSFFMAPSTSLTPSFDMRRRAFDNFLRSPLISHKTPIHTNERTNEFSQVSASSYCNYQSWMSPIITGDTTLSPPSLFAKLVAPPRVVLFMRCNLAFLCSTVQYIYAKKPFCIIQWICSEPNVNGHILLIYSVLFCAYWWNRFLNDQLSCNLPELMIIFTRATCNLLELLVHKTFSITVYSTH